MNESVSNFSKDSPRDKSSIIAGATRAVDLSTPVVMGVLNVTPDSFSDGGQYSSIDAARSRALEMIESGAAIIDIGGESTRPGAAHVPVEQEIARVVPVVQALRAVSDVFISVDTSRAAVIRRVCEAGADMINDVRGLSEDGALTATVEAGAATCLMHMQGRPSTMQAKPHYDDVVAEVAAYLGSRIRMCREAGMPSDRIVVDPGFGFGKTLSHNLNMLRSIGCFRIDRRPVLMGVSRKSMFGKLFDTDDPSARINGSLGAAFWATLHGVGIIRAHDVRETVQMIRLAHALTWDAGDESIRA